ncbi:hypothetical protein AXG93_1998s1230 [Marchantia polymorpha subsp. ruderalis]|uniref:non-specific serine/threonine protein kinase n=1 Tax=Marchantia polymorpha subsp. ruderalis TaxID=1480154 RepID=A0A176VLS8_MARPO|nr:hypothetical protein AXG93_1998s1230 [Marchantia polymorpha subsp. ruderalis]
MASSRYGSSSHSSKKSKRRKFSGSGSGSGGHGYEPRDQTAVSGTFVGNPYLLADRLSEVYKLVDDHQFFDMYEEETNSRLGQGNCAVVNKLKNTKTGEVHAVKKIIKNEFWEECPMPIYKVNLFCEAACFLEIIPKHENIVNLAIDHLHQHGIIHGDMKLENICVKKEDNLFPILIDFGNCRFDPSMVRKTKSPAFNYNELFTPFELKELREFFPKTDKVGDVPQLANILRMLLTGQPHLKNSDNWEHYPMKPETSPDALALLEFMEDSKLIQNTTVEQLMQHCWFDPERLAGGSSSSG